VAAPYFGNTAHAEGEMTEFVKSNEAFAKIRDENQVAAVVAALSAQAQLPYQADADRQDKEKGLIAQGETLIKAACTDCHNFGQKAPADGTGYPDLAGYGSRDWLIEFISDPAHARFYGEGNDRMPSFAKDRKSAANNILTHRQIELLADWLRRDYFEPAEESE
jgi:mono/diheme cytochrome c family protein